MHKVLANVAVSLGAAALMIGTVGMGSAQAAPTPTPAAKPVAASAQPEQKPAEPAPKYHEVGSGDSLSTIAEQEQLESWRPLWNANPDLQNPDLIYEGQKLTVPQGPTEDRPLPEAVAAPQPVVQQQAARTTASTNAARSSSASRSNANYAAGAAGVFERIRMRESGGNYAINTGNGYYGAYQFSLGTWQSVGGTGLPSNASPAEQDMRAQMLYDRRGCSPWPNTCY